MATHWPPITITLTEEGARIYTAGVLTTTLKPDPGIHTEAMAVARQIAASYQRVLPVTASSPDGEYHMLLAPDGTIHTEETPSADTGSVPDMRPSATDQAGPETTQTTAELATLPHTLPHHAHTPEVLTAQTTPAVEDTQVLPSSLPQPPPGQGPQPSANTHVDHPPTGEQTSPATQDEGVTPSPDPHDPPAHQKRRTTMVITSVLAALVAATGIAVHSLHTTSAPQPAAREPAGVSTFLDIPPRPTQTPTPAASATVSTSPTPTESPEDGAPPATPAPQEAAPPAPVEEAEPARAPQEAAPPAGGNPPQTVPQESQGLSSMNTSVSTPGGGSATVTVHVQGSGSAFVSVSVGGVSTTMQTQAPGSASATLNGVPLGVQSWTTSADGLINSGTVTVY